MGFRPRKALGQNFLIRERVIDEILRLVDLSQGDAVLEIGPGIGFVTRRLAGIARKVWAIEVDPLLMGWLKRSSLGNLPSLDLIHGDFLDVHLGGILPNQKVKVVANLPYSISTPILFRLFEEHARFSFLVLMVQQEVAERMKASPGTKSYGTLSVWCQVYGHVLDKVSVSPDAFFPRPKVRSTILKIGLHEKPLASSEDLSFLRSLVRASFEQRRKVLSNALSGVLKKGKEAIEAWLWHEGIDPRRRGETLSVEEFLRLASALRKING
jgi:16S rRNA (adenine1518-N6/adenine1519-N6)-dimethyltransferase